MAYPPEIAAALSGATLRQLSYWRSLSTPEPLLKPEFHKPRSRVSYSFQDVVALRAFVFLRGRNVPLQRVRKAVHALRALGEVEHLSKYSLVVVGRDVVWRISADDAVDLTGQPGQHVIAQMIDILAAFPSMQGRKVVPLFRPESGVSVDPEVRGGYPVIEGTRVPFDIVAGLVRDGLTPREVRAFYPGIGAAAARGAAKFARYVDTYRSASTAA